MSKDNKRLNALPYARTSLLAALAVALSFLESLLPELPIPGAKPGFSNLAVLTAADTDGLAGALTVSLIKSGFVLITRGPTAGVMSLAGGLLSAFIMRLIIKYDRNTLGYVGVGICGAAAHNMGQFCFAFILMGSAVKYYLPFLLIIALPAGAFTGTVSGIIMPAVKKTENLKF